VKITIEKKENQIRVQGERECVLSVQETICEFFQEVDKEEREKFEAKVLGKKVKWLIIIIYITVTKYKTLYNY